MKVNLFGYTITNEKRKPSEKTFVTAPMEDGSDVIEINNGYVFSGELEKKRITDYHMITQYRTMSILPECESAIDEILNDAIAGGKGDVRLNISKKTLSPKVEKSIHEEFTNILHLLNWRKNSYEIFKRWYVDGRIYFHKVIDEKKPKEGITELRYIDPRKIKKIKEIIKNPKFEGDISLLKDEKDYFIYDENAYQGTPTATHAINANSLIKISKDSVAYASSGLVNEQRGNAVLSYLHKAIKPLNQLRMLEDATVIYTLSRAPERRIFYVDTGNLPKQKAEQQLLSMMNAHKNKMIYDTETGELRDDKKTMSMLEDFWMIRREGNKGTEITNLPGGMHMGETEHLKYFQRKLYKALHLPVARIEEQNAFGIGRTTEITREEVKFSHFIDRLRIRFSVLFEDILKTQLLLKNIITEDEWNTEVKNIIEFHFPTNSIFAELKDMDILKERLDMVEKVAPYEGKYFSNSYIRKKILMQTDDEIREMDKEIEQDGPKEEDDINKKELPDSDEEQDGQ